MPFQEKLPDWHAEGVEPPESKRNTGWEPGERPPAEYWNWQMHRTFKALEELQQKAAEKADIQQIQQTADEAKTAADAAQAGLAAHTDATTGIHGATSAATPNTLMQRDPSGRAQVATPSAANDAANKSYVDNAVANRARTDVRPTFAAGIQDGDANSDVSLIKSVQHHTHTRSITLTYSGGNLSTVTEKDGANTVKTTTLNYSGGKLVSVVEVAGGVTVTQTLQYDASGNLTGITRSVS